MFYNDMKALNVSRRVGGRGKRGGSLFTCYTIVMFFYVMEQCSVLHSCYML